MSILDNRYYVDQHVAAQWADDTYRPLFNSILFLDSGIIQQIRERVNSDGSKEFEYYIHYIDCIIMLRSLILRWQANGRLGPCVPYIIFKQEKS